MSRDAIKYVAMLTMLLNHVANIFLVPGTFWREFLVDLGYFTMPVMCYFLVEGFGYTRSRKRYGLRLAIFAALSELPFCLAFSRGAVLGYVGMNMIFTLLLCFGMLVVMEAGWDENLKNFLVLALAALSWDSDWAIIAPLFTLLFYRAGGVEKRVRLAFLAGMGIFFCRWAGAGFGGVRACGGAGLVCGADAWDGVGGGGDPLSLQWQALCAGTGVFEMVFLCVLPGASAAFGDDSGGAALGLARRMQSGYTMREC